MVHPPGTAIYKNSLRGFREKSIIKAQEHWEIRDLRRRYEKDNRGFGICSICGSRNCFMGHIPGQVLFLADGTPHVEKRLFNHWSYHIFPGLFYARMHAYQHSQADLDMR